jgi:hypothetical protein
MVQRNENDSRQQAIEYILIYAIENGGRAGYNPCAYYIGFDDSNKPSESFNEELKKYGRLEYHNLDYDYGYSSYNRGWSCFVINEYGKQYIAEKEKKINGPLNLFLGIRRILTLVLNIIQIPFIIEGWISYLLNLMIMFLSKIIFIISLLSFVWWPIDMLSLLGWVICDYLKYKIWGKAFLFKESIARYMNHYPIL